MDTDVLIVGAGPVGLTLGCVLACLGVRHRILSKEPELRPIAESRAEGVHPRTLHLLEQLGLLELASAWGREAHGVTLHLGKARLARISLDDPETPFFPGALILEQGKVERVLAARLVELGGTVELGREVVSVSQREDQAEVVVRNAGGGESTVRARYVVGCDGARSIVRSAAGVTFEGEANPGTYALADVDVRWDKEAFDDDLHIFMSPLLIIARLPEGTWKVASLAPSGLEPGADAGAVLEALSTRLRTHGVQAQLGAARWTSVFRISWRMVNRMVSERIILAGDAAHIHSPMGGQGMNEGMHDAANLGWKLAAVVSGKANAKLLRSYDEERLPIIADVLKNTAEMTKLIELGSGFWSGVRDAVIPIAANLDVIQRAARLEFSGAHRALGASTLLLEHTMGLTEHLQRLGAGELHPNPVDESAFARGPAPGRRAIDVDGVVSLAKPSSQPRRLFRIWADDGPAFVHRLLLFTGDATAERLAEIVKSAGRITQNSSLPVDAYVVLPHVVDGLETARSLGVDVLIDAAGSCAGAYGARWECAYLVRPDGFIGGRSQPIEEAALTENLKLIIRGGAESPS